MEKNILVAVTPKENKIAQISKVRGSSRTRDAFILACEQALRSKMRRKESAKRKEGDWGGDKGYTITSRIRGFPSEKNHTRVVFK